MKKIVVVGLSLFFFTLASCSSSTMIMSNPSGAKAYIGGSYIGTTPCEYSDMKVTGSSTSIRLEKEGYEPAQGIISKNGDLNVGALIGGIFFWFPFIWIFGYRDSYQFELQPVGGGEMVVGTVVEEEEPVADRNEALRELKDMYDDGVLTKEEYEREKKKILRR